MYTQKIKTIYKINKINSNQNIFYITQTNFRHIFKHLTYHIKNILIESIVSDIVEFMALKTMQQTFVAYVAYA